MSPQTTTAEIKVAIVEDEKELRHAMEFLIRHSPGFTCLGAYASAEAALEKMPAQMPDVVLMDIKLPGLSGIECIQRLKDILPNTQFMVLTAVEDDETIFQSLTAGASGYILKSTPEARMLEAIRDLHQGGSPMSGSIARRVVQIFQKPRCDDMSWQRLTDMERKVITRLEKGLRYKDVAVELGIVEDTVRKHTQNIYRKLHVNCRFEALKKVFPARAVAQK